MHTDSTLSMDVAVHHVRTVLPPLLPRTPSLWHVIPQFCDWLLPAAVRVLREGRLVSKQLTLCYCDT